MYTSGGAHAISSPGWGKGAGGRRTTALIVAVLVVLVAGIVDATARLATGRSHPSLDTRGWVHVVDRATGFTDRLPAQPRDITLPAGDFGGNHVEFHLAVVGGRTRIEIEDGEITPGLPADAYTPNLRAAIFGFVVTSGVDLLSQGGGRFHGWPAWHGTFRGKHGDYTAVAFMESARRLFLIVTTTRVFDAVAAGFRPIALASPAAPNSSA